jgi:hypothetical protein
MGLDPVFVEFLGVLFRWLLTSAGTYLVTHHILTAAQSESYATAFAHDAILGLPMLGGLALGLWARYKSRVKFLVLASEAKLTEHGVNLMVKSGAPTPSIFTPPSTVPGVPLL